MKIKYIMY